MHTVGTMSLPPMSPDPGAVLCCQRGGPADGRSGSQLARRRHTPGRTHRARNRPAGAHHPVAERHGDGVEQALLQLQQAGARTARRRRRPRARRVAAALRRLALGRRARAGGVERRVEAQERVGGAQQLGSSANSDRCIQQAGAEAVRSLHTVEGGQMGRPELICRM